MTRSSSRRRGLSLAEVLIAVTIASGVLVAVATSFEASSATIEKNDRFATAVHSARLGVNRLVFELRTCETCQVGESEAQADGATISSNFVDVIREDGSLVRFTYDAAEGVILLEGTHEDGTPYSVVLVREVTAANFQGVVEANPHTGILRTVRTDLRLTVAVEEQSLTLTGAAVPRREMVY